MITSIAHVCFGVPDLQRSESFYRDILGFAPAYDFVNDSGKRFGTCLYAGGRTFVELFVSSLPPSEQGHRHVCFEVDDIHAEVARLRKAGIEVTDPKTGSDRSLSAWLKDPDGNRIELQQYAPDSKQTLWLARVSARPVSGAG